MKFQDVSPSTFGNGHTARDPFLGNSGDGCQTLHLYEGRFSSSERV